MRALTSAILTSQKSRAASLHRARAENVCRPRHRAERHCFVGREGSVSGRLPGAGGATKPNPRRGRLVVRLALLPCSPQAQSRPAWHAALQHRERAQSGRPDSRCMRRLAWPATGDGRRATGTGETGWHVCLFRTPRPSLQLLAFRASASPDASPGLSCAAGRALFGRPATQWRRDAARARRDGDGVDGRRTEMCRPPAEEARELTTRRRRGGELWPYHRLSPAHAALVAAFQLRSASFAGGNLMRQVRCSCLSRLPTSAQPTLAAWPYGMQHLRPVRSSTHGI